MFPPFIVSFGIVNLLMLLAVLGILYIYKCYKSKPKIKPVQYISYKKDHFNTDFTFTCEYCDNRLRGKSSDERGCSHCGASYKENLELLAREEEDRLEKCHYDEYMQLREWECQQNIKNEQRDAYIETKHRKKIDFMMGYGKYIALAVIAGMAFVAMGITVIWMKLH